LPRENIHIDSITASKGRRELLREILQSGGVSVVYTITAANADVGLLTAMLSTKVSDGSFATALQSSGFTSATVSAAPTIVDESPSSRLDMITFRNHYLMLILSISYTSFAFFEPLS
jgi:hypothetical protein